MAKFILYVAVTILVIWAMDSVNINKIFKQNRNLESKYKRGGFKFKLSSRMGASCKK